MDVLNKVEYRVDFLEDDYLDHRYFDKLDEAYQFITKKRLYTFKIVKEELIASRYDVEPVNEET